MRQEKPWSQDLEEAGTSRKSCSEHVHNVGTHDRCGTTVEPMIKPQWFVKMEEMAKPAIEALQTGRLKFVPESFGKTYLHWLERHPRLVYFQTALVGTQNPGLLL